MLREDTDETLDAAEDRAMDHNRTMFFAVLADIAHVKFLRHLEIELDRATLPRATKAVLEMEIDLWSVECTVARVDDVILANRFQRRA